jgi:hypothetical protein
MVCTFQYFSIFIIFGFRVVAQGAANQSDDEMGAV